jgi:hypothetical protein
MKVFLLLFLQKKKSFLISIGQTRCRLFFLKNGWDVRYEEGHEHRCLTLFEPLRRDPRIAGGGGGLGGAAVAG